MTRSKMEIFLERVAAMLPSRAVVRLGACEQLGGAEPQSQEDRSCPESRGRRTEMLRPVQLNRRNFFLVGLGTGRSRPECQHCPVLVRSRAWLPSPTSSRDREKAPSSQTATLPSRLGLHPHLTLMTP